MKIFSCRIFISTPDDGAHGSEKTTKCAPGSTVRAPERDHGGMRLGHRSLAKFYKQRVRHTSKGEIALRSIRKLEERCAVRRALRTESRRPAV